ncbi:CASP-like protein 4D1 [Ziziphus jujuba]|uniref:CASP-like protein n=1 Tax=Ziziphus jujuba TaxID=326968 RepID=A0ABM3IEH1_ZIZJJ|nr:CASP-like protein 4D1 [Ziziphus jujuba]
MTSIPYTILQLAFSVHQVVVSSQQNNILFDFYGDKYLEREERQMESIVSSRGWRIAALVLRVLTILLLLVSFVILLTNVLKVTYTDGRTKSFHFYDVVGFKYMVATIFLGLAYSILQTIFAIGRIKNENYDGRLLFDFYGDKVISNLLATGAAAGFIATRERQESFGEAGKYYQKHFNRSYASACILLLAFVCTLILSVISSYALPKRVNN